MLLEFTGILGDIATGSGATVEELLEFAGRGAYL